MTVKKINYLNAEEQAQWNEISAEVNMLISKWREYETMSDIAEYEDELAETFKQVDEKNHILSDIEGKAKKRYFDSFGSDYKAVFKEASGIIAQLEKKDFQDWIKPLYEFPEDMPRAHKVAMRKYATNSRKTTYSYDSAIEFCIMQISGHFDKLKEDDTKINFQPLNFGFTYHDILLFMIEAKVSQDFGYKDSKKKSKADKISKKQTEALDQESENNGYLSTYSDRLTKEMLISIGKPTAEIDRLVNSAIVDSNGSVQIMWDLNGFTHEAQIDTLSLDTITILVGAELDKKLWEQIPAKGTMPQNKINDLLVENMDLRTVKLHIDEYRDMRKYSNKSQKQKSRDELSMAGLKLVSMYGEISGKQIYRFSNKPEIEEIYNNGELELVYNVDYVRDLYTKGQQTWFPENLLAVDLFRHKYAVPTYNWLLVNYLRNRGEQTPNTNRVKVGTTIDNIADLKLAYIREEQKQKKYYDRVVKPLLEALDQLKKIYKVIDYELLDKDKKTMSLSEFSKKKFAQQKECWIRYRLIGYPDWKPTERLTREQKTQYWVEYEANTKKKKEDKIKEKEAKKVEKRTENADQTNSKSEHTMSLEELLRD